MTDEAEHLLRSELNSLKAQIDILKRQLENVEPRVRQMEPAVRMIEINNGNPEPISPAFGEAPIPQLWGEDPKPWAVEWEPRENGGSGSWLIYLPETGSFKENTLTPSLDSAFSTMRSSMESSTARPNSGWMILEVSSSTATTVYLRVTTPTDGTPTMNIATSAATGAVNFPIAAVAADHTVSQYLFGELVIGGTGGGGGCEYYADTNNATMSGVASIDKRQQSGGPEYFGLHDFEDGQNQAVTAELAADDVAGYYAGQQKSLVPAYKKNGTTISYLDFLFRKYQDLSVAWVNKELDYGRIAIKLPKLPTGDGKSVALTTSSSTEGVSAKYGIKDFASPSISSAASTPDHDEPVVNLVSGEYDATEPGWNDAVLVRTNSGSLEYRRLVLSVNNVMTFIASAINEATTSSSGVIYGKINEIINSRFDFHEDDPSIADKANEIKEQIANKIEEHEQKAESATFANSHVP